MVISTIVTRENEETSIEKLAAQREMYSKAKVVFYIQTFITVFLQVLLSFTQLLYSKVDLSLIIATVSVLAVITDNLLELYVNRLKEEAARIQELFDTYVLNIEWNKILCLDKPEPASIYHYFSTRSNKDLSKLSNWYEDEINSVSEATGKVICQKSNCNYDCSIREKYNNTILVIGVTTILIIFLFSIFSGVSLAKIILTVFFPAAPIIQWTHKNIILNKASIKNLRQLNSLINSAWDDIKNHKEVSEKVIRQIQDGIFLNRKASALIPDFVYNSLRDELEKQTRYTLTELVREING